ncbi:hypothetical protein NPIL_662821 [Nephila pilipes]|uniref:Uncharacterized protein n=1 Tax=Nephila pilipes TaxID=299642 RepID=A0A8X6QNA6_NEPPI|nr:hypothetical protein NPIL_662821 [Nephila pilipes]
MLIEIINKYKTKTIRLYLSQLSCCSVNTCCSTLRLRRHSYKRPESPSESKGDRSLIRLPPRVTMTTNDDGQSLLVLNSPVDDTEVYFQDYQRCSKRYW